MSYVRGRRGGEFDPDDFRSSKSRGRSSHRSSTSQNSFGRNFGDGSSSGRGKGFGSRKYPIGARALENLLERENYMIPVELLNIKSGYRILLEQDRIKGFMIGLIIKLLNKSLSGRSNLDQTRNLLQITFESPHFIANLLHFLSDIKHNARDALQYLPLLTNVMQKYLSLSPMLAFHNVSTLADMCLISIKNIEPDLISGLEQSLKSIDSQVNEFKFKFQNSASENPSETRLEYNPPEDFKELNVIPTCAELKSVTKPFLRPQVIKGKFDNAYHYLDTQFRLLKEDFVQPLREGLHSYLYPGEGGIHDSDIKIYSDVIFESTCVSATDIICRLKLNLRKNYRIENSKRFMYGNILCISADNFESMIIASVVSRDELENKVVGVKLESGKSQLSFNEKYVLVESKAYFTAYKHTLKALQNFDNVPFEDYFVFVQKRVQPPKYLDEATTYEVKIEENISSDEDEQETDEVNLLCIFKQRRRISRKFKLQVLSGIERWPSCIDFEVDESQRRALHGALTREIAIIQGPPGTGKTFLGLQIAKLLLHNACKWVKGTSSRILVVCYTNHALDQFLEGMISFTKNIVRVGSQSKVEALKRFQINRLEPKFDSADRYGDYESITNRFLQIRYDLKQLKNKVNGINEVISALKEIGILDFQTFANQNIIPSHLEYQLEWMTMEYFLIERFLEDESKFSMQEETPQPYPNSDIPEEEVTSEKTLNQGNEWMANEEYQRKLDDADVEEDSFDPNEECPTLYVKYEVTPSMIEKEIMVLQKHLLQLSSGSDRAMKPELNEHIEYLNLKLESMIEAQKIIWTNEECEELESVYDLEWLDFVERWKLYLYWKTKLLSKCQQMKSTWEQDFKKLSISMTNVKRLKYLKLMRNAEVIGMTTTAAAEYCDFLHDLAPPIVIVEEAAEIMEAHILGSISEKCQHLILIGDHQQLRPKPNVYELGVKYHLDVSLFERMVKNGVQYETLEYQHRMKPVFSNLLVPALYENLKDHDSVEDFPKIKGVRFDLFFVDHNVMENPPYDYEESETFENLHEAKFMMGLCNHLILQGYSAHDITILTPYAGQFKCFKRLQREPIFFNCSRVRIAILDNYQGEESNIILLSLVRSNKEQKVGFMKKDNRVCVALSRAKHGMYIIGNMTQMSQASPLWSKIKQKLINGGHIGPKLPLECQMHPDETIEVRSYEDFTSKSPEGGCNRSCLASLPDCKHRCPRTCHVYDRDHTAAKCFVPCAKVICEIGHGCVKTCNEKCGKCLIPVHKELPCSHDQKIPCSVSPKEFKCTRKVDKVLPLCKHIVNMECHVNPILYEQCNNSCYTRLECGHQCKRKCHPHSDPDHEEYNCEENCERICDSGHECQKKCYEDCSVCPEVVTRTLECSHTLSGVLCGVPEKDIVCPFRCAKYLPCGHRCPKTCGEACGGCSVVVEKTITECGHAIKIKCDIEPTPINCNKRCMKILSCGHCCSNKCCENCTLRCKELVETSHKCPRGHPLYLQCHENNTPSSEIKAAERSCSAPCGMTLECQHKCRGTCGQCLSGRLHAQCLEKCQRTLVCGHKCIAPCSANCPPCQRKCSWKCSHSKCKKKCGVICRECKEPCNRKCKHSSCTQRCGELCDRKPCCEPCLKVLQCGHPCIGFCGEPCPPLCRVCDKDQIAEIGFWNEDAENARFVLLEDCNHVLGAEGLDLWMKSSFSPNDEQNGTENGMKMCPLCNEPIYNTKRYQFEILEAYHNVVKVKNQHFMSQKGIHLSEFLKRMKDLRGRWPREIDILKENLGYDKHFNRKKKHKHISNHQVALYNYQLSFLEEAKDHDAEGKELYKQLIHSVMQHKNYISHQTMQESLCELRRLKWAIILIKMQKMASTSDYALRTKDINISDLLIKAKLVLDPIIKFDNVQKEKLDALIPKELIEKLDTGSRPRKIRIGITRFR